jgi:hypothetical protein
MDYLIYDCEIEKLIPPKDGQRVDGYDYCEGWGDHAGMGVSVVGFGYADGSTGFWDSRNLSLKDLQIAVAPYKSVIGFNSKKFDDKLMAAHGVTIKTTYDLLDEILIAAGWYKKPYWKDGLSYALGKIGEANGFPKTGTGELAPKLWQDGAFDSVIEYCLNDVRITHELLKLGWAGELIDPNDGKRLKLRTLEEVGT